MSIEIQESDIDRLYGVLKEAAEKSGYYLNPDEEMTRELVRGLLINEQRYGYRACPCRLASGKKEDDMDIICPCDYRDADISEYGTCYCGLYVSQEVAEGKKSMESIPERRPPEKERRRHRMPGGFPILPTHPRILVWRCRVCGYLCAREEPPEKCPICGVGREHFEQFG